MRSIHEGFIGGQHRKVGTIHGDIIGGPGTKMWGPFLGHYWGPGTKMLGPFMGSLLILGARDRNVGSIDDSWGPCMETSVGARGQKVGSIHGGISGNKGPNSGVHSWGHE